MKENDSNQDHSTSNLRQRAEQQLGPSTGSGQSLGLEETQRLLYELQVHQVELEMQNKELRRVQAELEASHSRYFDLFEMAPVGYVILNEPGLLLLANLTAAGLLGMERSALAKQPLTRFILPDDQDIYYLHRKQLFKTGAPQVCELRMLKKGGVQIWVQMQTTVTQDADGAPVYRVTLSDITTRKQAEEALRVAKESLELVNRKRAEEALHASENKYRLLVDNANEAIFVVQGGMLKFANRMTSEISGYTEQELTSRPFPEFIHPDDREMVIERHLSRLKGEVFQSRYPFRLIISDGSVKWVEIGAVLIDWEGKPATLNFISDITERKRANEELRESEEIFSQFMQNSPIYVFFKDEAIRSIRLSSNYEIMLDKPVHELLGKTMDDLFPSDLAKSMVADDLQVLSEGKVVNIEEELNGRLYTTIKFPIYIEGRPRYLAGFTIDITERKQAENALQESERKYRQLIESLHEGIWVIDKDSQTTFVNPRMAEMLGYTVEEMIGKHLFSFMDEQGVKIATQNLARRQQGIKEQHDFEFLRKDGTNIYAILETAPMTDQDGNYIGAIAGVQDITERRQLTEKMLASDKLAGLGTLAAGVAHEINSPLQVITGDSESMIAQLKEGEVEPKEITRRLERVNRNAWRIAHIVRSMLSYARSEQEQLAQADLNSLVSDALLLTEHQVHVWSNIEVVTELAENMPEFTCDRNKIIQVLINLLSNARDAMPNGGSVTLRTGFDPQSQRLTLTVSDTGQGIPKDLQSKIFDPFFTTKPPGQGIGLGLSVVQGIMNAHGGEIKVDSAPGQGSTFLLTFALTPPPPQGMGGTHREILDQLTWLERGLH